MQKDSTKNSVCLALAGVLFYGILLTHTYILYPYLPIAILLYQALLRLGVAIAPLIVTALFLKSYSYQRYALLLLWLLFIPYPLYNFFQLRHIAEIWRIPAKTYFTSSSFLILLWQIIPVCIYSISQLFVFFYCLHAMTNSITSRSRRLIIEVVIIAYTAAATVIGLNTRLDTFHIITSPLSATASITKVLANSVQLWNAGSVFCMAAILYTFWQWLHHIMSKTRKE